MKKHLLEIDVYISDFGAARKVGSPMIEYSEEFADPKSLGKPLSFAIDFYSLGKIYIELFGGFPERSVAKKITIIMKKMLKYLILRLKN